MSFEDKCLDLLYKLGKLFILTDINDVGRFDRFHHWHLGLFLKELAVWLKLFQIGYEAVREEEGESIEDKLYEIRVWLKKHGELNG